VYDADGGNAEPVIQSTPNHTGLFEMIVGVLTASHLVLQMQPRVISFYGVTSRIRFMFILFLQVRSIPELKVRIITAIETISADVLKRVLNEFDYRVDVCRITKGAHIEQL